MPLQARGRVFGAFCLANNRGRPLKPDAALVVEELAARAGTAIDNARLFADRTYVAQTLQRSLLPGQLPEFDRLGLAARYLPGTPDVAAGGDWYDVLAFDNGATGIVVGDVVGHDIAASTSMGQLRSALRAYAYEEYREPAATLAHVDRLYDSLGLTYATCIFGVLDPDASTFRWSNAGHPPPLLLREGQATFLTEGNGVLLGVTGGAAAQQAEIELQEDDVLVLYTDGLVERRGESLQTGLARLSAVAAAVGVVDTESLCDQLLDALVPSSATRDDDVVILVARVRADAPTPGVHRLPFDLKRESPALTRGFTAGVLRGAGWDTDVDTAVLLVSELVTNAVRHARPPCALVVTFGEDAVELSVEDGDTRAPSARHAAALDENGRGLMLVSALADEWGVRPTPEGKATWFRLRARR